MRVPLVALVGKPNVGKSTLFNRLVGKRIAIVDDQPGVTRDRMFGEARMSGRVLRVVDTGGIGLPLDDGLLDHVRAQTRIAVAEADLVILVLDAEEGVTGADREVVTLLRKAGKPFIAVGNKVDVESHEGRIMQLYEIGVKDVIAISAEHGRGFNELEKILIERLDPPIFADVENADAPVVVEGQASLDPEELPEGDTETSVIEWAGGPIRVAVVGRPNVGKSSLINRLLGEERHLASPIAGTTRDAIDSELVREGQRYIFTDTAGMRRKRSVEERLERFAVMMAMRGLDGADVAVIALDASQPPGDQDARIVDMALQRGKGVILLANKWDLISGAEAVEAFEMGVERQLGFADFAPLLRVSAKTGRGVDGLLEKILEVQLERHRRIRTGELNRFFKEAVHDSPPPVLHGRRPKMYFVSQPMVRPPTFVFTASNTGDVRDSYTRYLQNALRKRYGFAGTPLWIKYRGR